MTAPPDIALDDYAGMWAAMAIRQDALQDAKRQAEKIIQSYGRYDAVRRTTGIPAWWIGCIHMREASGNFACHLHNGDPLSARTVHVPAGRPIAGQPPFSWAASAVDALMMRGLGSGDWSIPSALRKAEAYNGMGYQARGVRSPYVWGGTTLQQPGKYIADHVWDATVMDTQIGAAALMQILAGLGIDLT
jgi:lysozyme family protein